MNNATFDPEPQDPEVWFETLRRESETGKVGDRLAREVYSVAESVVHRYPAVFFSPYRQDRWNDDTVQELAHECVVRQLKSPDQVRMLFHYANDLRALRSILFVKVRRTLQDIRATDVVDNITRRLRTEINSRPEVVREPARRDPTAAEIAAVARAVSLVRELQTQPTERAPRVYSPSALKEIADLMINGLPGGLPDGTIQRILRQVLTHHRVVALVPEVQATDIPIPQSNPAEEAEANAIADAAYEELTDAERTLVKQIFLGWNDTKIADYLQLGRTSAVGHKRKVEAKLRPLFTGVNADLADRIATRLYERLTYEQ